MTTSPPKAAERGRPRAFAHATALAAATDVFWKHGFQNASLTALTDAMGINRPSMYASFGDKESLYLQALDHYLQNNFINRANALEREPDVAVGIRNFLQQSADLFSDPVQPGGCFVINGAADCGGLVTPPAIEAALQRALVTLESSLCKRLERAQREGQLAQTASPSEMSVFLGATLAGMAVLAKAGTDRKHLAIVVASAMQVFALSLTAGAMCK